MEKLLQQARQAFQERYGVSPEEKGFGFVSIDKNKVCFSRSERALKAFVIADDIAKRGLRGVSILTLIAVLAFGICFFNTKPQEEISGLFIAGFTIYFLGVIAYHTKKEQDYDNLKAIFAGRVVVYRRRTKEMMEY